MREDVASLTAHNTSLETTQNVARRLGRSVRTIERWVRAGILPLPMQVNGRNLHRAGVMPKADEPRSGVTQRNAQRRPGNAAATETQ